MSTLVSSLITRASVKLDDPGGARTKRPAMLQYFNEVQDEIATALRVLRTDYYFDLEANEGAYKYPENRVQMAGLRATRVNPPTGPGDYYPLLEKFEDEFRALTWGQRPAANVYAYFAQPEWFELINLPAEDIVDGGIISILRVPTWVEVETPEATMELPDFCRTIVQQGMEILARYTGRDRAAASDDWQRWQVRMMELKDKIDDPSLDRRASIRPTGADNWTGDMH